MVMVMMLATALAVQDPSLGPGTNQLPDVPRVRSDDPTLARLITEASALSRTFRRELDLINRTNGIVYVSKGRCRYGAHACLIPTVDFIGPFRLLRVLVDLTRSEAETIGSIGHELWHAIEVLSDPSIDSNAAIVFFFKQFTESNRFETAAATKVGVAVYEEVRAAHDRDRRHPPSRD
ncbi:MAG TPA: hypothetical protein VH701_17830 [Vicinamibacterales bacterium]|jgi:hypothetical protein